MLPFPGSKQNSVNDPAVKYMSIYHQESDPGPEKWWEVGEKFLTRARSKAWRILIHLIFTASLNYLPVLQLKKWKHSGLLFLSKGTLLLNGTVNSL